MIRSSGDRLTDPETWAEALEDEKVFRGLRDWAAGQPFRVSHVRRLTGGRSRSYVAVARIRPDRGMMHHVVLKILPPEIATEESLGVALAESWTPKEFWDRHMVPTTGRFPLSNTDWQLHIQRVAHANLAELRPLASIIDEPHFASVCGSIIQTIVDHWHRTEDPELQEHTPRSFLEGFLDRHADGLAGFAAAAGLDLERPANMVHIPGRAGSLHNPFALLAGTLIDPETEEHVDGSVEIYVANGHGDLQLFNVLVPEAGPVGVFRLIDYGRFSPEMPVSRDPAKLLLAAAAAWLPALRPGTALRSSLAELVVDPVNCPEAAPVAGYLEVSRQIFQAARQWGEHRDMRDYWLRQHLLVLAGSALRMVADADFELPDRWWFFEVAALATRAFAGTVGDRRPAHAPTPPSLVRQPRPPVPGHPGGARPGIPKSGSSPWHPGPSDAGPPPVPETVPGPPEAGTWGPPDAGSSGPRDAGAAGGTVVRPAGSARLPGLVKVEFVRRIGDDWRTLADLLDIPLHTRQQFDRQGDSPGRAVWEWLEVREQLGLLPQALETAGRPDLAAEIRKFIQSG